jgi:hypothetical protein
MAMVHIDAGDLPLLERELIAARRRLGREDDYTFKHVSAKPNTHHQFYAALRAVPGLTAHIHRYNRATWTPLHVQPRFGDPCICDGLITLTLGCPQGVVADQRLYIDYPRREKDIVDAFRTALRQSLRAAGRRSFGRIQPRPDQRLSGEIVQVADMIAGEAREQAGIGGVFLPQLGARVQII